MNRDKIRGMFMGVAIGDALGMPVETMKMEEISARYGRITNYVRPDGHKWYDGMEAGIVTDDTQLTIAVAESLIACKGINMDDMARRHVEAFKEGALGWGPTTREALQRLAAGVHWSESGKTDKPNRGGGNGVAMKVAPIGAFLSVGRAATYPYMCPTDEDFKLIEPVLEKWIGNCKLTIQLTTMTHYTGIAAESALAHTEAVFYCLLSKDFSSTEFWSAAFGGAVLGAFLEGTPADIDSIRNGEEKNLADRYWYNYNDPVENWAGKTNEEILAKFCPKGAHPFLVYNSLPLSHAFFLRKPHGIEALYDVVNAGGDTDTNGSIVGSLLGALNGMAIFPAHLVDGLKCKDKILDLAERFCAAFDIDG